MIKSLHIIFAVISISGFILRGILKLRQHPLLQHRLLKVLPHINDSLLLLSAIVLLFLGHYNLLQQPWLITKIILLFVYIGLGLMTLRFAKTKHSQSLFFVLAIGVFLWIVGVALSKSPLVF